MNTANLLILLSSMSALGPTGLPADWDPLTFPKIKNHTSYEWSASLGAVHAIADKSASGLAFRLDRPVSDSPILRWRWKISNIAAKGNEHKKSGDDYAARVFVTFLNNPAKAGLLSRMKSRVLKLFQRGYPPDAAINYIWANTLPQGESVPNPYTNKVMMVCVRSGNAGAGEWRSEERNILEDYRRLFGKEPPPYYGVAIMTDSDDTQDQLEAWYSDISLSDQ